MRTLHQLQLDNMVRADHTANFCIAWEKDHNKCTRACMRCPSPVSPSCIEERDTGCGCAKPLYRAEHEAARMVTWCLKRACERVPTFREANSPARRAQMEATATR